MLNKGRLIGIIHRRKQTAKQEARPTIVAIKDGASVKEYKLETETDELDFLLGRFPTSWRAVVDTEELSTVHPHKVRWTKMDGSADHPLHLMKQAGKQWFFAHQIPKEFDGIKTGDTILSPLGGSGDRFIYAIAKQANINVYRVPPFTLKDARGLSEKEDDPRLLLSLWEKKPEVFRRTEARDLVLIKITEAYRAREDAMKARIACEQRLLQRLVGKVFLSDEGGYPEGKIEDLSDAEKANDKILTALKQEEGARVRELTKLVEEFPLYRDILGPEVEGCGPMIAARIIVAIGDIRRFPKKEKFRAYCGLHVTSDGKFVRKRAGEVANWKNEARQAFFLLADQFNRRPTSVWGKKLREVKVTLRGKHPEPVERVNKDGKKVRDYTDGHIQKMALWRTATLFGNWLYREWSRLEREASEKPMANNGEDNSQAVA